MKLTAFYGCRSGAESFSCSLEYFGDQAKEQVGAEIDNLFNLARQAVQKQIDSSETALKTATTTQPRKSNGGNGKDCPATEKQINLIGKFLHGIKPECHARMFQHVLGREVGSCTELDRKEASRVVSSILNNRAELMRVMTSTAA